MSYGEGWIRIYKDYVTRLEDNTRMIFVEIIQEVEKVDLRIQKRQFHGSKRHFIE